MTLLKKPFNYLKPHEHVGQLYSKNENVRIYKKQGRIDDAKRQLEAVIRADHPHYRFAWERTYRPHAEGMLKDLASAGTTFR